MSEPYGEIEMQCFCEKCECQEHIRYRHKDDWGSEEDYACEKCLDKCYPST